MQLAGIDVADIDTKFTEPQICMFQSILGGLSWLVQCRPAFVSMSALLSALPQRPLQVMCSRPISLSSMCASRTVFCSFLSCKRRSRSAALVSLHSGVSPLQDLACVEQLSPSRNTGRCSQVKLPGSTGSSTMPGSKGELLGAPSLQSSTQLQMLTCQRISFFYLPPSCTALSLSSLESQGILPFGIDLYIDCRSILDSLRQDVVRELK